MIDRRTRVCIVYPTDPLGSVPGGIETFVRGVIRSAPTDIEMSVVGATTDAAARPVGKWIDCSLGHAKYRHFPVYLNADPRRQPRIPATVRFMAQMLPHLPKLRGTFDVLEFHRVEPVLLFLGDATPKTAVFHTNMDVIRSSVSDIRWRYAPGVYFRVERALLRHLASAFMVREDAVEEYRRRYPDLADRFRFTPTWMDPEVFHPVPADQRSVLRESLLRGRGVSESDRVLITVGRLDRSKDPLLLASAFAALCGIRADLRLIFVGDGVLRADTEALVRSLGVSDRVTFTGLLPPIDVAGYLNASDLFVLASAYEGMPMSLLEALACGLPVCSTDVGEVRRVVLSGVNGEVVAERSAAALTRAISDCLDRLQAYRGRPALEAVRPFVPEKVLEPLYENYRRLARSQGTDLDRPQ